MFAGISSNDREYRQGSKNATAVSADCHTVTAYQYYAMINMYGVLPYQRRRATRLMHRTNLDNRKVCV
jgi:hypothetical protein